MFNFLHGNKRPVIGITKPEERRINFNFMALWLAIWFGGGRPLILTPESIKKDPEIHGLMLGGGTDVFPGLFQKEPKKNYRYDHTRDKLEIDLLNYADEKGMPVFAICRGAQLMNVVNQGSLHMDVSKAYKKATYPEPILGYTFFRKKIIIEEDSLLHNLFKRKELYVNSLHKQSIDRIGKNLVVTARELNGVVQAIERPGHPFYLGVQFHPELLIYRMAFRSFFRKFIWAVRTYRDS